MEQRLLGKSGLSVSTLSFGTMTLGGKDRFRYMGAIEGEEADRLIGICLEAGVNLIDTADVYSFGAAEEVLGQALKGRRHQFLLSTKAFMRMGTGPHDAGLSRAHLMEACEASLRRLKTDYIDLYLAHGPDALVPMEETLRAYDDLVSQGKARYVGCSNFSGWHLMKALSISDRDGLCRFISQQVHYSLLWRDIEHELIPLGLDQGVGVMAWSPLAYGLLSGKFLRSAQRPSETRLNQLEPPGVLDQDRLYRVVEVLLVISSQRGVSPAQVAINWVASKPGVDTVIIGARNEQQLRDNLAAAQWQITAEEVARLDEVSALPEPYPYWHQHKFGAERNPLLPSMRRP